MTAKGHYLTALAMGLVGVVVIAGDDYSGRWTTVITDFIHWSMQTVMQGYFAPPSAVVGMLFLMGAGFGAFAPDWLEVPHFGKDGLRRSLIPHRGATHGIVFWAIATAGVFGGLYYTEYWLFTMNWLALGFTAAALLHCLIDAMSPSGVPVVPKWRIAMNVYRTGEASELRVILPVLGSAGAFIYLYG